jgi:hypothetical protein
MLFIIFCHASVTSFDNSLVESNSYLEFKYPQDAIDWNISDQDLIDASPSNANINLEQKFGNAKKCHKISGEKLVFRCED